MEMEMTEYNGWTNYETWNVALWVDNDESVYHEKLRLLRLGPVTAEDIREFYNVQMLGTTPDLDQARDNGETIDPVNFQEIADAWNEEEYD
jgi:hypothetical protein